MTAPFNLDIAEAAGLKTHYRDVAFTGLRAVWRRKFAIVLLLLLALVGATAALVLIGPLYTAEALLQFDFKREQPVAGTAVRPIAVMEATSLVESIVRVIRSRATASAVVARLKLDGDPKFAREPISLRLLSQLRAALGLPGLTLSPRDLAVNTLMRRLVVNGEQRSYVISLSITTDDPERSASIVNAVAFEYLRGEVLQQIEAQEGTAERELARLSSSYGVRHPTYLIAQSTLESLRRQVEAVRDAAPSSDIAKLVEGETFIAAEHVLVPSGPNIPLVLGLTVGGALLCGVWLALLLPAPPKPSRRYTILAEPRMEPGE
jgi:uncharacterized protein involved in exopolysaccharide biosynthesis